MFKKLFLKIVNKKKTKSFDFSKTESVLFRMGDGIGDAVVLTSAFNQLRKTFPNIKLGYVCNKHNEFIFKNSPLNIVCIKDFWDCLKNRKKWQIIINLEAKYTSKYLLYTFLISPQYTIAFPKAYKKYYNKDTVITDLYVEQVCHFSKILSLTPFKNFVEKIPVSYVLPEIPKENINEASSLWNKKIKILVCPKGAYRQIDPDVLYKAISALPKEILTDCRFLISLTKNTEEYKILQNIKNGTITFAPPTNIQTFIGLIKSADIVLSVDSAPVHLAVACNKYLIGLFLNYKDNLRCFAPEINEKTTVIKTKKEYFTNEPIFKDFDIPSITKALEKYINIIKNPTC